jgi:hypothetical protein
VTAISRWPRLASVVLCFAAAGGALGCGARGAVAPRVPERASVVTIDRFSDAAGHSFRRSLDPTLPAPNAPIDFDAPPFYLEGFAPDGKIARYYRFDQSMRTPGTVFVLYRKGQAYPVPGQLYIVDDLPGDPGYCDIRRVVRVTVPESYPANLFTSMQDVQAGGYPQTVTDDLLNMPLVPSGSSARRRMAHTDNSLQSAWYRGAVAHYFLFEAPPARVVHMTQGLIDTSLVYVTYVQQDDPRSGFLMESVGRRTHNVFASAPGDSDYTPLCARVVYDNGAFNGVGNLSGAVLAKEIERPQGLENCPIVDVLGLATGSPAPVAPPATTRVAHRLAAR